MSGEWRVRAFHRHRRRLARKSGELTALVVPPNSSTNRTISCCHPDTTPRHGGRGAVGHSKNAECPVCRRRRLGKTKGESSFQTVPAVCRLEESPSTGGWCPTTFSQHDTPLVKQRTVNVVASNGLYFSDVVLFSLWFFMTFLTLSQNILVERPLHQRGYTHKRPRADEKIVYPGFAPCRKARSGTRFSRGNTHRTGAYLIKLEDPLPPVVWESLIKDKRFLEVASPCRSIQAQSVPFSECPSLFSGPPCRVLK
jgi:hypothetical protein